MKKLNPLSFLFILSVLISFSFNGLKTKSNLIKSRKSYEQKTIPIPFYLKNAVMCSGNKFSGKKVMFAMMWSNPSTWTSFGATKPVTGSSVIIPAGVHIILDENPPILSNITVYGV